jgi:hypothetical protein
MCHLHYVWLNEGGGGGGEGKREEKRGEGNESIVFGL